MKVLKDDEWNIFRGKAEALFAKSLGKERVSSDALNLTLKFDLTDPVQYAQFDRFAQVSYVYKLKFLSHAGPDLDKTTIAIFRNQQDIGELLLVAQQFVAQSEIQLPADKVRPFLPDEPEFVLEKLTTVPWGAKRHQKLGNIIEPVPSEPLEPVKRRKQLSAVGYVLRDKSFELREWLEHQQKAEEQAGEEPKVAVPAEWVSRAGIERATGFVNHQPTRDGLAKVFLKTP